MSERKLTWLPDTSDERAPGSHFVQAQCPECKQFIVQAWRPGVREREKAIRQVEAHPCNCGPWDIMAMYLGREVVFEGKRYRVNFIDRTLGAIGLQGRDTRVTIDDVRPAL